MIHDGPLGLIGNTPLVRLTGLDTNGCEVLLKMESHNPGGSIKDRIGLSIIRAAEREGRLVPGQRSKLIEATAGNTGLGLALVAAQRGYELTLVVPDKMSREKILHLKALGARVLLTRSDVGKGHPAYYQDMAARVAEETGAYYVNQFENPANPLAHETTTGPEIFAQTGGQLDAVVCGVGSGGTLTGLSRFFARALPSVEMVLADPVGSILADYVKTGALGEAGSWFVEGIGEDFIPPIADLSRVRHAYSIPDEESFATARALLQKSGILGGSSTGTLLAATLRYCREQTTPKRVVTFVCDSGNKYLSKMFDDLWMVDQGLLATTSVGDLSDLVTRKLADGAIVSVAPDEPLQTAYARMRTYEVSQVPVLEGDRIVGLLDESDLLLAAHSDPGAFKQPVRQSMSTKLHAVSPGAHLDELLPIFDQGMVAIVLDHDRFVGLITRVDVLNLLRRKR